jgi:hypothetical protein
MRNGEMVRRGSVRAGAWFSHGSKNRPLPCENTRIIFVYPSSSRCLSFQRTATPYSSTALRIPSFSRMLAQWTWTVFMLIPKASAISRVGLPRPR